MTTTHAVTHTETTASVLVELDGRAIEALMPEIATTGEVAAGVAGFIERAVSNTVAEAFDNDRRRHVLLSISARHPVAIVFRRDRDGDLIRFRDGEGGEPLDSRAARVVLELFQYGRTFVPAGDD